MSLYLDQSRIRATDDITVEKTAGASGQGFLRTLRQKAAQLDAIRTALQAAALAEVDRRIGVLNRRFPRHQFSYISGNGVFYVWVQTPRGGRMDYLAATGFMGDFALRAEEQFQTRNGYLEVRSRAFAAKPLADLWAEVEAIIAVAVEFEEVTGWAL